MLFEYLKVLNKSYRMLQGFLS